jgi:anti-sigma-K factor RskA
VLWRWSTAGFAAIAASLALWIAVMPAIGPCFVAVLHSPQQDQASWIATAGRSGLVVRAVAAATPPIDRAFELWAIAPGVGRPRSLGVIPPSGEVAMSTVGGAPHAKMAMQTFPVLAAAGAHDVYPAPDGAVWFTAQSAGKLGRLDPIGSDRSGTRCCAPRRDRWARR